MPINSISPNLAAASSIRDTAGAQEIYHLLKESPANLASRDAACAFLEEQLEQAAGIAHDMPTDARSLAPWMEQKALETGDQYSAYLETRKAGAPRRYFTCKAHALSFLQRVAPTKLVDGAWLYGILQHWEDPRFYPLIRIYLEELGNGDPAQNHVVLYQQLLQENDCEQIPELDDEHYVQGAIQLALAFNAEQFMPEIIGYNLGYEQLPLHLLITAFELNELEIDPYYFTLHVTVDNVSTGHARKAIQAITNTMPTAGDTSHFWQRVANGYQLNELGLGTVEVIGSFDLEQELFNMLERKSHFGKHLHSDLCSIGGRTVNEWLASPGQIQNFFKTLQAKGWLKRHQDPQDSHFWRLIEGPQAPMAGVFSSFEKQLLHDWLTGDRNSSTLSTSAGQQHRRKIFRRYPRPCDHGLDSISLHKERLGDLDQDISELERELPQLPKALRMRRLISLMAPATHATAAGLYATRQFTAALS